ncbi:hypothetical protein WA026_014627 [Henosepilachna vigintioctopunctata]|uniref:Uncharacterized protein n=1 Tax=Henosepilachna vigintioctopunctata TaxID=420089 RepID=A0AAW1V6R0_9CUCU
MNEQIGVKCFLLSNIFLFCIALNQFMDNTSNACLKQLAENISENPYTLYVGKPYGVLYSLLQSACKMNIGVEQLGLIESPFVYNILHFEDIEDFNETLIHLKTFQIFGTRIKCICITENESNVKKLIEILWLHHFYKSLVVLEKPNHTKLYEIDYEFIKCGSEVSAKEGFCSEQILNPDIKRHFKNCKLKALFAIISPWIFIEDGEVGGIFVDFLKLASEINGLKLIFMPHNPIYGSDISENYNFDSLYEDFENGIGDIFVGLVNNFPTAYYFESSPPLIDEGIFLVIPKGKRMSYWKAMFRLYSVKGWILTFLLFLMFYAIICILGYVTGNKNFKCPVENFMFTYALYFALPIPITSMTTRFKILFLAMCWIFTINSIIIQGKLYSVFSVPIFERDIKDLKSLFECNLPIVFKEGMVKAFLFLEQEYQHVLDLYTITNDSIEETAANFSKTKDFVTIFHEGIFVVKPHLKDMVTTIDVAKFLAVYLLKKQHVLLEELNFTMDRLIESGFMEQLLSAYKWKNLLKNEIMDDNGVFTLSLVHLQGAFFILLTGYFLSSLAFFLELLKKYYSKG